jgi:hypothetical protein
MRGRKPAAAAGPGRAAVVVVVAIAAAASSEMRVWVWERDLMRAESCAAMALRSVLETEAMAAALASCSRARMECSRRESGLGGSSLSAGDV